MKYEEFSKLWDEIIGDKFSKPTQHESGIQLIDTCSDRLREALIAYGEGKPSAFDNIKERMAEAEKQAEGQRILNDPN